MKFSIALVLCLALHQTYGLLLDKTSTDNGQFANTDLGSIIRSINEERDARLRQEAAFNDQLTELNRTLQQCLTKQKTEASSHHVVLSAFGTSNGYKSSGTILKFPDIKTQYGFKNSSGFQQTGILTIDEEGLYLILTVIMAGSVYDSKFQIYKNNQTLSNPYYIGSAGVRPGDFDFNSGTGAMATYLRAGDTLFIKSISNINDFRQFDMWSSFTILKIY